MVASYRPDTSLSGIRCRSACVEFQTPVTPIDALKVMPRYVILYHQTPDEYVRPHHWDLMMEDGDALATWALEEEPKTGVQVKAVQLAAHRLAYLEYEGPISGNRGHVQRCDYGTFEWRARTAHEWQIELSGNVLCGLAELKLEGDDWTFRTPSLG